MTGDERRFRWADRLNDVGLAVLVVAVVLGLFDVAFRGWVGQVAGVVVVAAVAVLIAGTVLRRRARSADRADPSTGDPTQSSEYRPVRSAS